VKASVLLGLYEASQSVVERLLDDAGALLRIGGSHDRRGEPGV
jgi:hypothetical protein